ncbi:MAG: Gfo/Idh/MocA family oxidoreductase [Planctomycetota bacterium]|nr:Gfo/Idh/MocA family oxidoreductase [Planctomycetota bacterium]MDA0933390.1 Gfo/Idh/MocA family oxidoreductase [Planctomycetota bacterium]MDA1222691.1 Gfo/Idh/MocA family oxidoreductase [Planctomycetota bacterium]
MQQDRPLGIGLVGAGFIAATRARCYRALGGRAALRAVATRNPARASDFAQAHGVAGAAESFDALLARDDIDLVDLCVPNDLHRPMTEAAARAGKHVVCTKPLTAYVGQDLGDDPEAEVAATPRRRMLELAVADAEAMVAACDAAGVQLMYGENWVYAPGVVRAAGLLGQADGTILDMRGGESHKGSHSPYSKLWRHTGGGALLRLGAHPIGAMLWLKREEARRRGAAPIVATAVTADVADLSRIAALDAETAAYVTRGWVDVENWGFVSIAFSDGSRGLAWGADTTLGGMESRLDIQASNARYRCNLSPNDLLQAYAPDASVFGDAYIMEKVDSGAGWTTPIPDEDWTSGHLAMCADFVDAVRSGRPARSDGRLGADVVRVVYAAYVAAAEGRRVALDA